MLSLTLHPALTEADPAPRSAGCRSLSFQSEKRFRQFLPEGRPHAGLRCHLRIPHSLFAVGARRPLAADAGVLAIQLGERALLYAAIGCLMCLSWLLLFHVFSINPHLIEAHIEADFLPARKTPRAVRSGAVHCGRHHGLGSSPMLALICFLGLPIFYGITSDGLVETRIALLGKLAFRPWSAQKGAEDILRMAHPTPMSSALTRRCARRNSNGVSGKSPCRVQNAIGWEAV